MTSNSLEKIELNILDKVDNEIKEENLELEKEEIDEEKKRKREKERDMLISKLASNDYSHLVTRVAHVLNRYPHTRNSDIALQLKYWEIFDSELYIKGQSISPEDLFKLERLTSITRARAKVQNEYGLFLSDEKVRRFRKDKEEVEKEIQVSNKPDIPSITIYCDESGKNGTYAIVGSLWILERGREQLIRQHILEWRKERDIKQEFHFTDMKRNQLDLYVDFFNQLLSLGDMVGFKAIAFKIANNQRKTDELISDLHYQLVHQGIEHELQSGRVNLPRFINFFKDKEEGNDALTLTKIEQHLELQFKVNYEDNLRLDLFGSIESYTSPFIQFADLFTGSINRVLNESHNNHKDVFAKYVIEALGLDINNIQSNESDMATVIIIE
ncbi:DUF3800 domain-containing protein [Ammoniphilus sp. 3BR4]|uniref:DUF3800 domain-containing protein n=1 Tax=Ammoniphilus sp. 3BR4 TaxID=3158265 RepID=UPI003467BCE9